MKMLGQLVFGIGISFLATTGWADDLATPGNPYDSIVARNVFSLVPIPTNNPADQKQPDPPAKITPNGIMKLFGQLQVLFKVATPPKPGQPPGDQSYVMSEGDRQDGIAVNKIDDESGIITFDNHGVIQQLALQATPDVSTPAAGSGPNATPPMRRFLGGRFGRDRSQAGGGGGPVATGGTPSAPGSSASAPGYGAQIHPNANPDALTPEAQVILMEANRQQLQQQGDPTAKLIPPTEITSQVEGGDQNAAPDPNP
ncbi:MAG: hypothetical protein ABSE48_22615 [Verrucomicrobiota bacterium]|jgi:hypothetical protein